MSARTTSTIITARLRPELFAGRSALGLNRSLVVALLSLLVVIGFGFRAAGLGAEGLSEDELNKLRAVEEYRARGLTSKNGEHPLLMKALLTASVVAAETWNAKVAARDNSSVAVPVETALRLPGALFGALTTLLIFWLAAEIFGTRTALVAAALWSFDPSAISFNRIAKEDSFYIFFFLLANVFWLRSQRVAESGRRNPDPYYWAAAASFGAMLASKYLPHFFGISISYYWIFQGVASARWRLGKRKWLIFFAVMGAAFVLCNLTILLPGTWREMRTFAGERRIGHDSYEFMGTLYRNQVTLWLKGVPWYFYYAFIAFKLPPAVVGSFVVGLPLLLKRRLGDGRYFIIIWLFFWFLPFTVMGGKFTRYFTLALPAVLITSAVGIEWIGRQFMRLVRGGTAQGYAHAGVVLIAVALSAYASASTLPFYRLYTNALGGGRAAAGGRFPHDEFYDASTPEAASAIAARARTGALVASETPGLFDYYARRAGRDDLVQVSLSDAPAVRGLSAGDFVVVARGRRYFSNDALLSRLEVVARPFASQALGGVPSARIFELDTSAAASLGEIAAR